MASHSFDAHQFDQLIHSKSDSEIETLTDLMFTAVDGDGSGEWELPEVLSMFKQIAYHYAVKAKQPEQSDEHLHNTAERIFKSMDEDGDGKITKTEFMHYVKRQRDMYN